jgi:hypothetical protein
MIKTLITAHNFLINNRPRQHTPPKMKIMPPRECAAEKRSSQIFSIKTCLHQRNFFVLRPTSCINIDAMQISCVPRKLHIFLTQRIAIFYTIINFKVVSAKYEPLDERVSAIFELANLSAREKLHEQRVSRADRAVIIKNYYSHQALILDRRQPSAL